MKCDLARTMAVLAATLVVFLVPLRAEARRCSAASTAGSWAIPILEPLSLRVALSRQLRSVTTSKTRPETSVGVRLETSPVAPLLKTSAEQYL
jgi:hypothetical protein